MTNNVCEFIFLHIIKLLDDIYIIYIYIYPSGLLICIFIKV